MTRLIVRFVGHVLRLSTLFVLCTLGVFRVFFASLQPDSAVSRIIGETATPDQISILHSQIDPGPHGFFPRYAHWVGTLYPSLVITSIVVLAVVATLSAAYRRTPHDTDPKASAALLLIGTYV